MTEAIQETITVRTGDTAAFSVFTERMVEWWPHEYMWSGDVLEAMGIEPRVNGMCYERGPFGFQCHWGRVLAWDAPNRLVLAWQIGPRREPEPNPAHASTVEVRFVGRDATSSEVTLTHRDFDRHGEGSADYRAAMASPQGWRLILERFAAAV